MSPKIFDDPEHWCNRAEEARSVADGINDPTSKQIMMRIAADYDRMARHADERARSRHRHIPPWHDEN